MNIAEMQVGEKAGRLRFSGRI